MKKPPTTAQLQRIIERWDDGTGVTAAVQSFAKAVPVAERTVWYWLGGRKIHPTFVERIVGGHVRMRVRGQEPLRVRDRRHGIDMGARWCSSRPG